MCLVGFLQHTGRKGLTHGPLNISMSGPTLGVVFSQYLAVFEIRCHSDRMQSLNNLPPWIESSSLMFSLLFHGYLNFTIFNC